MGDDTMNNSEHVFLANKYILLTSKVYKSHFNNHSDGAPPPRKVNKDSINRV